MTTPDIQAGDVQGQNEVSFVDLALRQRAYRRFDESRGIPDSDIEKMLEIAVHAPSVHNWQPWEFVVVRSAEVRNMFAEIMRKQFVAAKDAIRAQVDERHFNSCSDGNEGGGLATAPVLVIVCADTERVPAQLAESSIFPAIQNLLLAAGSLGYGSCLTTGLTLFNADKVRATLGLPDSYLPLAGIFLGHATKRLGPPRREPATMHMHRERYSEMW